MANKGGRPKQNLPVNRTNPELGFCEIENPRQRAYLVNLAKSNAVMHSCEIAGISKMAVCKWRRDDAIFAEAEECAKQQFVELLEKEAMRRAVDGVTKGIYYQGSNVADEKVFSDPLLMALLRGNCPEKYSDSLRLSGGGEPIKIMSLGINLDSSEVHDAIDKLLLSAAIKTAGENSGDNDGKQSSGNGEGSR
jgi:hypothetical protein